MSKTTPIKYVRFHTPVPKWVNDEPVDEMKIGASSKYTVTSLEMDKEFIYISAKDQITIVPLANVVYVRT
jgi:hypothetical protein